ncbi:hypothetical protein CY35_09G081600 [Sphagnum magellanicum]|nr:hypothetical protein CY35_09G081600 [Sphagnum magellanicum]
MLAASTCGQAFRACLRNRDRNDPFFGSDAAPPCSKRVCSAAGGRLESHSVSAENNTSATASKTSADDGGGEESCEKNSGWESLELCLLERITRSLSVTDLCRLSQVSKHYRDLCGREEVWNSRSREEIKDQLLLLNRKSLNSNLIKPSTNPSTSMTSTTTTTGAEKLHAIPFTASTQLHFSGDVTILDPFELFVAQKEELEQIVKVEHKYQDLVLKYKGMESAVLRTNCGIDGDDSAFEVFRGGEQVGANVTSSGVLAVVPKQLVLQLAMHAEKNGGLGGLQQLPPPLELLHQVTVEGVHGVLRRSLDGDFIINHKEPGNCLGTKVEFPFNGEVVLSADVVCSTGGSWTEYSDSEDDDEEDLTEEEMAEALQEAAVLTLLKSCKSSENNIIMTTTTATTTKLDLSLQSCS